MDKKKQSRLYRILFLRTLLVGIFGGLFWGLFFLVMHAFKMTEVDPKALLETVFTGKWISKWYANLIFLFLTSLVSIIIAFIYYYLFKQRKSWMMGVIYGII